MEILIKLWASQRTLEEVLMLESTPEEVKETKEGKKLLKWLRRRRRRVNRLAKVLEKI